MITEFINHLEEVTLSDQKKSGSMSKVNYHDYYLAQECAHRLDYYRENLTTNKQKCLERLVKAYASVMGEYSKYCGTKSNTDINPYFIKTQLEEFAKNKKIERKDYIGESINLLVDYCNLKTAEKRKQEKRLITVGNNIMKEYLRRTL